MDKWKAPSLVLKPSHLEKSGQWTQNQLHWLARKTSCPKTRELVRLDALENTPSKVLPAVLPDQPVMLFFGRTNSQPPWFISSRYEGSAHWRYKTSWRDMTEPAPFGRVINPSQYYIYLDGKTDTVASIMWLHSTQYFPISFPCYQNQSDTFPQESILQSGGSIKMKPRYKLQVFSMIYKFSNQQTRSECAICITPSTIC